MTRAQLTRRAEELGLGLNELRNMLLDLGYDYTSGLVRGAEEAMKVTYESLGDPRISEDEL